MKRLTFLISLLMEENQYQKQHAFAAQDVARRLGVDIKILYAGGDAITQCEQLLSVIQSSSKEDRPDGIVCAPVGTTLMQVARQAVAAGIGWALLNREVEYVADLRTSHGAPIFSVTVDQAEIGRIQGRQIGVLLPEGGLVLYLVGPSGNSIAEQRLIWMQTVKPDNVQVRTLIGDWSQESGYKAVSRWLQLRTSHTAPVTLVASQNDDMALGARRAFEDHTHGEQRERWCGLPYIGCDCCPGAGQDWIRRGLLASSVVNPPTAGIALELMVRTIQTKSKAPERTIVAPVSYPALEKLAAPPARKEATASQVLCG
jgi:ribose transport system substrate-binding protein